MNWKYLAAAAAIAGSGSVFAADMGTLDLSTGNAGFHASPVIGASFTDTWSFTLAQPSFTSVSVTTAVNGNQDIDFSSIALINKTTGATFQLGTLAVDPYEVWTTAGTGVNLAAGAYTLQLTGSNVGGGASYGGNIGVTSAVPEPETYALMLAGIAAVGFMSRRRKG